MKVLFNDGLEDEGIDIFKKNNILVDTKKRDSETLVKEIGEFDGLVVRSATKVTRPILESGGKGKLKIVGRAGVGYDNIDDTAASENGIIVKIAPYGNTNPAAELALGLMLDVSRKISPAYFSLKNGTWLKKQFTGTELSHKTLGIIGCGRIGQRLSDLVIGFDMRLLGYDKNIEQAKENFPDSRINYTEKENLLKNSDYISLHTGGKGAIIGKKEIELMKPTAILINASRGENIEEEALYEALKEKRILGAGLDVYSSEPKEKEPFNSKFRDLDNVVLTPHLGASTEEGQIRTSVEIAHVVINYLLKGDYSNAINAKERVEAEEIPVYPLFIHHRDTPGAFAEISGVLARNRVNIRENPSRQIGKDGYASTVYLVHDKLEDKILNELTSLDFVKRAIC